MAEDMKVGLKLPSNDAERIASGKAKMMVHGKKVSDDHVGDSVFLVSDDGRGFGRLAYSEGRQVDIEEFEEMQSQHRINPTERESRWPDAEMLWVNRVRMVERFRPPKEVNTPQAFKDAFAFYPGVSFREKEASLEFGMDPGLLSNENISFAHKLLHKSWKMINEFGMADFEILGQVRKNAEIRSFHDALVKEMKSRGMEHESPPQAPKPAQDFRLFWHFSQGKTGPQAWTIATKAILLTLESSPFEAEVISVRLNSEPDPATWDPKTEKGSSSFIERLDEGRVSVLEDSDLIKKLEFNGDRLRGLWIAKRETPSDSTWKLERSTEESNS